MSESNDLVRVKRLETLEEVSKWDQHMNLGITARKGVGSVLVRLEENPTELQTDKLLDLIGSHYNLSLKTVLPQSEVESILGERDEKFLEQVPVRNSYSGAPELEDRYTYKVEDLIVDFGPDAVFAGFDFAKEMGLYSSSEPTEDSSDIQMVADTGGLALIQSMDVSSGSEESIERASNSFYYNPRAVLGGVKLAYLEGLSTGVEIAELVDSYATENKISGAEGFERLVFMTQEEIKQQLAIGRRGDQ